MGRRDKKHKVDFAPYALQSCAMFTAALPFPDIGPELFSFEFGDFHFAIRWYALAYIAGLVIGWRLIVAAVRRPVLWRNDNAPMTADQVEDLLTWIIIAVIVGGRLGYVLFYKPGYYLGHPLEIPMVWQGGMSFHGGFLGVVIAAWWFGTRHRIHLPSLADCLAFGVGPGLLLGRISNFINAELWGRPSDVPWAVIFPGAAAQDCPDVLNVCARHPSQLYEAALEGLILGGLMLWLAWRRGWLKTPGQTAGLFFAGYGVSRFIVEFFRQADAHYITATNPHGFVIGAGEFGITMGQLLSTPMIIAGVLTILWARRRA